MAGGNISNELKIYELSLLWKEAEYNFAFWERLNDTLDWDKAYKEALPAVLKTDNLHDYYLELMKFISLLRDGHTRVRFPQAVRDSLGALPFKSQLIGGKRVITNVTRSAADKVKRWSAIKKVNGVDMEEYARKHIYPYIWHEKTDSADFWIDAFLRNGAVGSGVTLQLETDGLTETVTLTRSYDKDWIYDTAITPREELREEYKSDSHRIAVTGDDIAVITIDTMTNDDLPEDFYKNLPLLERARGYVIDVRKNGGGNSSNSDAVAAAFIGGEFTNQRALHPIHIGVYKAWYGSSGLGEKSYEELAAEHGASEWLEKFYKIPRHAYYEDNISTHHSDGNSPVLTAPLVVLSSKDTGSAAEDFLIILDHNKRASIVGSASYGSTGQPLFIELESGGSADICTRNNIYPDGREFINIGVRPHIPFEMTLDDYKNGIDSVMGKGLEVIREQI
jgi:C-terminal processing protease CtpA/Prc